MGLTLPSSEGKPLDMRAERDPEGERSDARSLALKAENPPPRDQPYCSKPIPWEETRRAGTGVSREVSPESPRVSPKTVCGALRAASLVAQCSATPATVAATPPCRATPFQTQISVRHLPAHSGGGGGATPKFLGGVARHRCYTCKTL